MTHEARERRDGPFHPIGAALVIDAANVVGSVPDGWWKDRAGAAMRLRDRLEHLRIPAEDPDLGGHSPAGPGSEGSAPELVIALVVEGRARGIPAADVVRVVRAAGSGDEEIVAEVARQVRACRSVVAVTSDRELRGRVAAAGAARVRNVGWLRAMLEEGSC